MKNLSGTYREEALPLEGGGKKVGVIGETQNSFLECLKSAKEEIT
jgi:hypothetical protein